MPQSKAESDYRRYLSKSLDRIELMNMNKTLVDQKYCNAFCQEVRDKSEFTGQRCYCKTCLSIIHVAYKLIEENKITLEEFKENPSIINKFNKDVNLTDIRKCTICDVEKTVNNFEGKRNQCKTCRSKQTSERETSANTNVIENIELVKHSRELLLKYLLNLSKMQLCFVAKYYKIGRKSTEVKTQICDNIIKFFMSNIEPKLCQGGCGDELPKTLTICKKCQIKKSKQNAIEKAAQFQKNIEAHARNLQPLTTATTYTFEELRKLCVFLKIKFDQHSCNKKDFIDLINKYLEAEEKKKEEEEIEKFVIEDEESENEEDFESEEESENKDENTLVLSGIKDNTLVLNNYVIQARESDAYINLSQLCKAGNKTYSNWRKNGETEEFLTELSTSLLIGRDDLIKFETGSNENRATWGHPQVAINVAQWISPVFNVQVSKWIFEIGKEKSNPPVLSDCIQNFNLYLGDNVICIPVRSDGYVNITKLCDSVGKRLDHWKENKASKDLINTFISIPGMSGIEPLVSIKGGINKNQGTYAHPDIAIQIAQWCYPSFAIQVSKWIRELLITGSVELGKEKSNYEIIKKFKKTIIQNKKLQQKIDEKEDLLSNKEKEIKNWSIKYNKMLQKRRSHELKDGPGIYIYSTDNGEYHKVGKEETSSINKRLKQHRTSYPRFKLEYVVYTTDAGLLENLIFRRYTKRKTFQNHEELEEINLDILKKDIQMIIKMFNIEATIESDDEIQKYNDTALLV